MTMAYYKDKGVPYEKTFYGIKKKHLEQRSLFEDDDFPATSQSLFYSRKMNAEWKRPSEIIADPKLYVEGASRLDITQGMLGNSWLCSAISSLALYDKLLHRVVPTDQSFEVGEYAGIFHFQFWQYGEWVNVIVDDRLPTLNGKLIFVHSTETNEFWSALLEKAYAKLFGSYEALNRGQISEAMVDFTEGLMETYDLRNAPSDMITIMLKSNRRNALMGCLIEAKPSDEGEKLPNGLIKGQVYSVTDVRMVPYGRDPTNKIPLVRLRNPGKEAGEWTGAFSDHSREWPGIAESGRREMGHIWDTDGEFWMHFRDFIGNFTKLDICNLGPEGDPRKSFDKQLHTGMWKTRVSAGGCRNFIDTFWINPQYKIILDRADADADGKCTVIVSLMQKNSNPKAQRIENRQIFLYIYRLRTNDKKPQSIDFFKHNMATEVVQGDDNQREISKRLSLPPGYYIIVPSTFAPNQYGEFIVRIFTEVERSPSTTTSAPGDATENEPLSEMDRAMKRTFDRVAGDDQEIDAYELQTILSAAFNETDGGAVLNIELSKSFVSMLDASLTGKMSFEEFSSLWDLLRGWKGVFKKYDQDHSGFLNSYELRNAMRRAGYVVSNDLLKKLIYRFANKIGKITLYNFFFICARLEAMKKAYESFKGSESTVTLEAWLMMTVAI